MDMDNNKECMCLAVSFKLFFTEFLVERGGCDGSGVDHIEDKKRSLRLYTWLIHMLWSVGIILLLLV